MLTMQMIENISFDEYIKLMLEEEKNIKRDNSDFDKSYDFSNWGSPELTNYEDKHGV